MHCTRPLFWNNGFVAGTQEAANRAVAEQRLQADQAAAAQREWEKTPEAAIAGIIAIVIGGLLFLVAWNCAGISTAFNVLATVFAIPGALLCLLGFSMFGKPASEAAKAGGLALKNAEKSRREQGNQAPPPGSSGAWR